jgi:hypothetical protein
MNCTELNVVMEQNEIKQVYLLNRSFSKLDPH